MRPSVAEPTADRPATPLHRGDSRRRVAVVGSTGSIGTQTLEVLRSAPDRFVVTALGAARSVELLASQAEEFRPGVVAIADATLERRLRELLPDGIELRAGPEALASLAETGDVVLNAVVGFAGLAVTVAALESRTAAGARQQGVARSPARRWSQRARATAGAELVPVDSEHCAIHQCLASGRAGSTRRAESRC